MSEPCFCWVGLTGDVHLCERHAAEPEVEITPGPSDGFEPHPVRIQ